MHHNALECTRMHWNELERTGMHNAPPSIVHRCSLRGEQPGSTFHKFLCPGNTTFYTHKEYKATKKNITEITIKFHIILKDANDHTF